MLFDLICGAQCSVLRPRSPHYSGPGLESSGTEEKSSHADGSSDGDRRHDILMSSSPISGDLVRSAPSSAIVYESPPHAKTPAISSEPTRTPSSATSPYVPLTSVSSSEPGCEDTAMAWSINLHCIRSKWATVFIYYFKSSICLCGKKKYFIIQRRS